MRAHLTSLRGALVLLLAEADVLVNLARDGNDVKRSF